MSRAPKIIVRYYISSVISQRQETFNDWWDFADWLKQVNLRGQVVSIICWTYAKRDT